MPVHQNAHHGLHPVATATSQALTDRFINNPENGERKGYFLGVEFLQKLVRDLDKGKFDGVLMAFGESAPESPGAKGNRELIATPIKFMGTSSNKVSKRGQPLISVPGNSTEPTSVGSPPL